MALESQGQAYLMRVPSNFYLKEFAAVRRDECVTITVSPDRTQEFAEQGHLVPVANMCVRGPGPLGYPPSRTS